MEDRFLIRVWDKENKIMLYPKVEFFDDMIGYRYDHFETEPENLVEMQCTGLKDKNGKLIWEGDIVEIDWEDKRYKKVKEEIKWDKNNACWNFGAGLAREVHWSHKIIGNIYKNKELLEEKNDE